MRRARRAALASLPLLALAWPCPAAAGSARVCLAVEGALAHARMEGDGWARPARIAGPGERACFFDVPAGEHRLVAATPAGTEAELPLEVLPGEEIEVSARSAGAGPELRIETRGRLRPGTGFGQRRLRELPGSGEPWSLLETVETAVIADRIDAGGLWAGVPGRTSTHGSSWTQASFVTAALDSTDPLRTGTPLGWPALAGMAAFDAATAVLPVEAGPPGTLVVLERAMPPARWSLTAEGSATLGEGRADGPPASTPTSGPEPPVARHERSTRLSLAAGGPVTGSLRASVFGALDEARRFERGGPESLASEVAVAAVRALWTPGGAHELDLHADVQSLRRPFAGRALFAGASLGERDRSGGLEAEWRVRAGSGTLAWAAAGHRRGSLDADAGSAPGTFDRLLDGPAMALPLPGVTRRARTGAAFGIALAARRLGGSWHALRLGLQAARTSADVETAASPVTAGELLGGLPARAWSIRAGDSAWRGDDVALYASDAVALGRTLRLQAGLRLESSGAEARGAAESVRWTALSPRLAARWQPARSVSLLAAYGHYRHRLPLSLAAWGDPSAPRAEAFLWTDANGDGAFAPGERGALVARAGPGAPVGALDGSLRPPRTEEVVAGVEGTLGRVRVSLLGVHREEKGLAESVNVGVPASAYTVRFVPDPAGDLVGPQDDQMLPLYSRPPATFGADAFLLTSPAGHGTRHQGVELTVEVLAGRLQVLLGATAHRSEGSGAFRGFRPGENDQGLVGDLFDDPNAATHSRGRLFSDRAYTIKLCGGWRAPGGLTLGATARYQDGQPFSRLVLAALPQGLTPVHAIPNGRARFTFIATLDARAEKELPLGGARRAALVLEGFNLTQRGNEVEEVVVSGGSYRAVTFRQPPRLLRLGLRLSL